MDERIGEDGREEFRVRWKTYGEDDDTWEPIENLDDFCTQMIEAMRLKKKNLQENAEPLLPILEIKSEIPETAQTVLIFCHSSK